LGLDFITKLRPVSYVRKNDENEKLEYGLIAQELEAALRSSGVVNDGIISRDDDGLMGVRYNDLLAPMIKAIQEQNDLIKTQKNITESQQQIISRQQASIDELKKQVDLLLLQANKPLTK
jgi:hypothetical protein